MMVESNKLESIALAISQQASLLRKAGRTTQADGMERRASELRTFIAAQKARSFPLLALHAA
jgi:hypothetical protein